MNFGSDTSAAAHPDVLEAMVRANTGSEPSYGDDRVMAALRDTLAGVLGTEDFDFWLTASGTASNALALSCFCTPLTSILCHEQAHIRMDERGAIEFFTGGGRLEWLPGAGAKMDPDACRTFLAGVDPAFVHATPPAVLSITNLTECGLACTPAEVAVYAGLARTYGLTLHMDGARLANALVHTGASLAEMTWKAGVDVLTLGLTKTGAAGCELVILFGAARQKAGELRARAKRAGHMPPKMRFLAAQAEAMLRDGLWLRLASEANGRALRLAGVFARAGIGLAWDVEGNEVFIRPGPEVREALRAAGARFYDWPDGSCRFVCSWSTEETEIEGVGQVLARSGKVRAPSP